MLLASYEAEQHLLDFGRSDEPVCWTICGHTSGYISASSGREIYVLQDRCLGSGGAACHLIGRTREEWGDERVEERRFFDRLRLKECLDVSLRRVTETRKAAERKLRSRRRELGRVTRDGDQPLGVIARGPAMQRLVELVRRVAHVDATVLVTGESGSGKERIARLVHDESTRAAGPFVAINCGAIVESLLESELFGQARGAFTGATQDRPGLFEVANGGTLLLDEIGEVSTGMQVKLLRVLQEPEVRRVGENKNRPFNRLKVVELRVPALRERRDDMLPLARMLLAGATTRLKRKISDLSAAAAEQLLRYDWPGNVRELASAMECAVALAHGRRVELGDVPEEVRQTFATSVAVAGAVRPLSEVGRDHIVAALELNRGSQARTAEQLEIGTAILHRKLKSYGMTGTRDAPRNPNRSGWTD